MLDPTSDMYLTAIKCLEQVVAEAVDPKFKANRQQRLEKMKAKRERALNARKV